jgi:hypothetical protein
VLAAGNFNLLMAEDSSSLDAAVAHFLSHALVRGARVAVLSSESPQERLARFKDFGFDLMAALDDDQLAYIHYRPTLSRALGGADYSLLFDEVRRLAGPVERIAFLDPEMLFALESDGDAAASIGRFAAGAHRLGATALGAFVPDGKPRHQRLHQRGSELLPAVYSLRARGAANYVLESKGVPLNLRLARGQGYVAEGARH